MPHRKRKRPAPTSAASFRRRSKGSPSGSAPGTLSPAAAAEAARSNVHVFSYGPDDCEEHSGLSVDAIGKLLGRRAVTWINVDGLGDVTLLASLGKLLGLHPLAIEDVLNVHQRPKVEDYGDNVFVVLRMPASEPPLALEQVSLFVGKNFVLTFQEREGDCLTPLRERIRNLRGRVRESGHDYLAYAIIDAIVDHFFPVLDRLGDRLEVIEDEIYDESSSSSEPVADLHRLRQDLLLLRRTFWPLRETLSQLTKGEITVFTHETRVFLRDCQDHAFHLVDLLDACREMASSLMDLHQSNLGQRMNEVMKVLTLIATVFMPLGFVAGLYGMNFDRSESTWNMPELGWRYGYLFAIGVMLAMAIGFLIFFRRRGWIGGDRRRGSRS